MRMTILAVVVLVCGAAQAGAQQFYAQPGCAGGQCAAPAADPYGFLGWLNATRAQYGLPAVGYDRNLEAWALQNCYAQQSYGLGHHVTINCWQNSAMAYSYAQVPGMWMNSPAHRAALLNPSIRWIGIAGAGAFWTMNAR